MRTATLLDEELAALAPDAGPLPWLDARPPTEQVALLVGGARSLLLRGLAVAAEHGLEPAGPWAGLLAHLRSSRRQVCVQAVVDGVPQPDLAVLLPLPSGEVLAHDVSPDGVHLLTLLTPQEAGLQLAAALDPLGTAQGSGSDGRVAVVRVDVVDHDEEPGAEPDPGEVAVSARGVLARGRLEHPAAAPSALAVLDATGLAGWVGELLARPPVDAC